MYRSALRDNPDCGRTQHCRHRASGTQDEREIQLRVQLTHVGDNNAAKKYRRPLQVPFAIISLRVQRAVPIRPPRRSLTSHGRAALFSARSIVAKKNGGLKMRSAVSYIDDQEYDWPIGNFGHVFHNNQDRLSCEGT